jgi:hypothetical protein
MDLLLLSLVQLSHGDVMLLSAVAHCLRFDAVVEQRIHGLVLQCGSSLLERM